MGISEADSIMLCMDPADPRWALEHHLQFRGMGTAPFNESDWQWTRYNLQSARVKPYPELLLGPHKSQLQRFLCHLYTKRDILQDTQRLNIRSRRPEIC